MLNYLRTAAPWARRLKVALAAMMLAGGGAAMAAPVTLNLCAQAGTTGATGLPANTAVWGYAQDTGAGCGAVSVPGGPVLRVNVGDVVTIHLQNNLTVSTGLLVQGQGQYDVTGVAAGASKDYTFTASAPGTYLYEAAPLPGNEYQVPMGLYGALVVSPGAGQAYADPAAAFDDEAVLVLGELDPALNAAPTTFDMRKYAPKYFLINGKPYPATDTIASTASSTAGAKKLLLRYLNAGAKHHSMGVLGLRQVFIAKDGNLLPQRNHDVVAETIATGQTADAIVSVPAVAAETKYAVYEAGLALYNDGLETQTKFGGMLTFVKAGSGAALTGPTVTAMNYNAVSGLLTANVAAGTRAALTGAEYWFDSTAPNTLATTGAISTTIAAPTATGTHTLNLRGVDGQTPPGAVRSVSFLVDTTGPAITGLALTRNANGTVSLSASANDAVNGGSNVVAAEYTVDGGAAQAATLAGPLSPIRGVNATTAAALGAGTHQVTLRAQDAVGNWGAVATASITIVAPPVVSGVSIAPNPNNGSTPLSATQQVVRVSATIASTDGSVVAGEGFIDTLGAAGTGFPFVPTDGAWGGASEAAYADIPLANIAALTSANHTIYVRGKDSQGNWSTTAATGTLIVDKLAPTTSNLVLAPAVTNNSAVSISANISDTQSAIAAAEYFIGTVGAPGTGTAMAVTSTGATSAAVTATIPATTVAALATGNRTITVRGKDAAGNWFVASVGSPYTTATLAIDRTGPTFSGIALNPASIQLGAASVTLTVNGAADTGGSVVAGGEYWFGTNTITQGTGIAFTGTTTTIGTANLPAGTTTVSVRMRDAAGNWSTGNNGVRRAPLTVTVPLITAPGVTVAFSPATLSRAVNAPHTSTLTITLSNPNATAITGVGFTDNLPQGGNNGSLTAIANPSTTCGGTATRPNLNNRSISLAGGTIAPTASCTVTVPVQITTTAPTGTRQNSVTVNSTNANTGTGSGSLTITN